MKKMLMVATVPSEASSVVRLQLMSEKTANS